MTDPTIQKTWEFAVNGVALASSAQASTQAHQDRREMMLDIKNMLTNTAPHAGTFTSPWTVVSSSDGHTNVGSTDHWVTIDDLVWRDEDGSADFSWILLQQTGLSATFQLLIGCESDTVADDGAQIFAAITQTARNTDGTLSSMPTEAGTDERVIRNDDGTSQGYWGSGGDATVSSPAYRWNVAMSTDGECTRVLIFMNTTCSGFWLFDVPDNPASGWTNPYIAAIQGTNSFNLNQPTYSLFNVAANIKGRFSGTDTTMFLSTEGFANASLGAQMGRNQLDNTWPVSEMGIYSETSTFTGRMGTVFDLWWGEALATSGRYYPQAGTKLYVNVSDMIHPWDGSTILGTR